MGWEKKVIDQFWELKLIKKPSDIFTLDYKKINNLDGWGELSIKNLTKRHRLRKRNCLKSFYLFNRYKAYRSRKCKNSCRFFYYN